MRPANKKALLIATIMASLSTYLCPACTARAIPAGRIPVHMPAPVKKMEQPSRYQQLLAKYLEYINDPARTRRGINLSSTITVLHDPDLPNPLAAEGEDGLLARLRKMADKHSDGKLDFEDDIAGRLFDPTSSSSARIFATLLKENRVRTESVISSLYCIAYTLCPEWIQVAKDIYAQNSPNSHSRRWAALVLYRAGISRETYRIDLTRLAVENDDVWALENLFFNEDQATGEASAERSNSNVDLMVKLIGKKSAPEIRVACAKYAAAIGMNGLAEATCADLLSQKYNGQNKSGPTPKEDYPLARAKTSAMHIMFYTIGSELAFKQIYDLSRIPEEEMINGDKGLMPKGWVCTSFYPLAKMDIDCARGFIEEVSRYKPVVEHNNRSTKW